jgi:hypothetical protein
VLKRVCTSRAEWRLQPGKPDAPISAHYRLDCDYGTGVITCWEEGGSEPIYVCESHAKQLARPRKPVTDIRIITPQPEQAGPLAKSEEPARIQEAATAMPDVSAAPPEISSQPEAPGAPEPARAPEAAANLSADVVPMVSQSEFAGTAAAANDPAPIQEIVPAAPDPPAIATPETPAAAPQEPRTLPGAKPARAADSPVRSAARDLAYGNPAKAIVDESIWNLPPANQLAMVQRKISEYAAKLEIVLSESKATIGVAETIDKPLEQAVLEVIGDSTMSDPQKDEAVRQLGTLQEWAKHGLQGNVTPLQANQILLAIGDCLHWGGAADVPEQFKPVYRTLFANLKAAIRAAVPESQNLHDRLTNLYAAKSDLEIR